MPRSVSKCTRKFAVLVAIRCYHFFAALGARPSLVATADPRYDIVCAMHVALVFAASFDHIRSCCRREPAIVTLTGATHFGSVEHICAVIAAR